MIRRSDLGRDLRRFRVPEPRSELGRRVIDAGAIRLSGAERLTRLDRLWASRRWRSGWAAAVALILVAGAAAQHRLEQHLERLLGPPVVVEGQAPAPEALDLDASWGPRLAWAARAEAEARARRSLEVEL